MSGKPGRRPFPAGLTAKQRAVMELYVEGLTYAQIGAQLAIHVSTVRSHVRLGVRKAKLLAYGDPDATNPPEETDGDRPDHQPQPPD